MGQALYRKYRSKSLAEIVGQEHITDALSSAIKSSRISHAYLFTGPRGVGKTSIARILAYEINNIPYDSESTHLDIIEIDAASNRRIDEIRDLRDKIHISPASAKYKVYIIDEVHMLTREAFNALLKTLEEPPKHIVFILATTEVHKLPETIISRTQHYTFRPINNDKVVSHLQTIAKNEKISITPDALSIIADHGDGSFRDSISILDQARSLGKKIDSEDIEKLLGIAPIKVIEDIFNALKDKNAQSLIKTLQSTRTQGITSAYLSKQVGQAFREAILNGATQPRKALHLLDRLLEVQQSSDPSIKLEIVLLDYIFSDSQAEQTITKSSSTAGKNHISKAKVIPRPSITTPQPKITPEAIAPSQPAQSKPTEQLKATPKDVTSSESDYSTSNDVELAESANTTPFNKNSWPDVMALIKQKYNTLYGTLRMAKPEFSDNEIILHLAFAFHQKRLSEPKNKKIIGDAIMHVAGSATKITCVVTEKPSKDAVTESTNPPNPEINNISNIFGGAELLES